jgi:myo-inositol-1(or 4)-monophosphatase
MPDFLAVCLEAAHRGGAQLLDWQSRFSPKEKGPQDLVTEADVASQTAIRDCLLGAFPDHDFLGEEEAADRVAAGLPPIPLRKSEFRWIVDPLDGTANYVHRLQTYAVSIALEHQNEIVLGVVYDPVSEECFAARKGEGATLNGLPLKSSACNRLDQAMIAVSFSANVERGSIEITRFVEALHACRSVRRLGSAALNLSYLAAGRLDAYWATSVQAWDVAAGFLLVEEAGGKITAIDGQPVILESPQFLASANAGLHDQVQAVLGTADREHRKAAKASP